MIGSLGVKYSHPLSTVKYVPCTVMTGIIYSLNEDPGALPRLGVKDEPYHSLYSIVSSADFLVASR